MTKRPNLHLVSNNPRPDPPTDYDEALDFLRRMEERHRAIVRAKMQERIGIACLVISALSIIYFFFQLGRGAL
jgi:hypothetical protein